MNPKIVKFSLFTGDILFMYISLFLALILRHSNYYLFKENNFQVFIFSFTFIFISWLFFLYILDFYEIPFNKKNILLFIVLGIVSGIIYFYFKSETLITPRVVLFLNIFFFTFLAYSWRIILSKLISKEKVVVIDPDQKLKDLLKSNPDYEIVAFFDINKEKDISKLKNITKRINHVVLPVGIDRDVVKKILDNLSLKLKFIDFIDFYEKTNKKIPIDFINESWLISNISKSNEVLKRIFDISLSLMGIILFSPFFVLTPLVIKMGSRGPAFYTQKRVGKNGKEFNIYKFRTMFKGAEEKGVEWSMPNDPRVTPAGKLLRKVHLDETPQFFNVLKGNLSFVGPRPERPEFINNLKKENPYYNLRHLIKPGLTGWAQINYKYGNSTEDAIEKLKYDLYYIKNKNIFLDLIIVLNTFKKIIRH